MSEIKEIAAFYRRTGPDYEEWGGPSGSYHFGYFVNPQDLSTSQLRDVLQLHEESHAEMLRQIVDFVDPKPGEVILDAGCGVGSLLLPLRERGAHVIGLTILPEDIQKAQQRIGELDTEGITLVLGDYHTLRFPDQSMDKVVMLESLTHSTTKGEALLEIKRVLKPGGSVYIMEPMIIQPYPSLPLNAHLWIDDIVAGKPLTVSSYPYLAFQLKEGGFFHETRDVTSHVYPSIQLAAASAEAHINDFDVPDSVYNHRRATIAYRELTREGIMKYVFVKGQKIPPPGLEGDQQS